MRVVVARAMGPTTAMDCLPGVRGSTGDEEREGECEGECEGEGECECEGEVKVRSATAPLAIAAAPFLSSTKDCRAAS